MCGQFAAGRTGTLRRQRFCKKQLPASTHWEGPGGTRAAAGSLPSQRAHCEVWLKQRRHSAPSIFNSLSIPLLLLSAPTSSRLLPRPHVNTAGSGRGTACTACGLQSWPPLPLRLSRQCFTVTGRNETIGETVRELLRVSTGRRCSMDGCADSLRLGWCRSSLAGGLKLAPGHLEHVEDHVGDGHLQHTYANRIS